MKIDELPIEILMKIFNYLPTYDKVSLVNQRFYNVACKVNDSNVCLLLTMEMYSNLELMESIRNTNRKITKVSINFPGYLLTDTQMQTTIFILKKFSASIKYLKIVADFFEVHYFHEILSLVPNAECLVFDSLSKLPTENEPSKKKRRIVPSSDDLALHKLKTLKLHECDDEFLVVFNRLPAGVLTELQLRIFNLNVLTTLFKRQTNIKKFNLFRHSPRKWPTFPADIFDNLQLESWPTFSADIFDNLQLESLMWRQHFTYTNIEQILSKQTSLKVLFLNYQFFDEGVMNVVTNQLTELETLAMDISKISVTSFMNMNKLKKLKNLTLMHDRGMHLSKLESFAKLNNSRITALDIRNFTDIPVEIVRALAKSVPNLKIFRFNCSCNYMIFNAFRRHFNFVEAFIGLDDLSQKYDTNHLILDECINPKLIELNMMIPLPHETPFLNKLINDYPNLKKLSITSSTSIEACQFKLILNGLTKLESLELFGASNLTIDDLDCLKEHKRHLKFILFSNFKFKLKTWHKKRIRTMYDVVKFGSRGFLAMSVNTTTMKYMNNMNNMNNKK